MRTPRIRALRGLSRSSRRRIASGAVRRTVTSLRRRHRRAGEEEKGEGDHQFPHRRPGFLRAAGVARDPATDDGEADHEESQQGRDPPEEKCNGVHERPVGAQHHHEDDRAHRVQRRQQPKDGDRDQQGDRPPPAHRADVADWPTTGPAQDRIRHRVATDSRYITAPPDAGRLRPSRGDQSSRALKAPWDTTNPRVYRPPERTSVGARALAMRRRQIRWTIGVGPRAGGRCSGGPG